MRTTITACLIALGTLIACGQNTPTADELQSRMSIAGMHLEKAARAKQDAVPTFLVSAFLGAIMTQGETKTERIVGWSVLGATASGMVTVRLIIASKEHKAARALQGKPPF